MTETVQKWIDQAKYDLDTARAMLDSRRYLYVLFCCQQAIEKALKAKIVSLTGELPPRINNLVKLAEMAKIELNIEQSGLCKELTAYYYRILYLDELQINIATITREIAVDIFRKSGSFAEYILKHGVNILEMK